MDSLANRIKILVYLTPDGRAPTTQSFNEHPHLKNEVVLLSYRDDIYKLVQSTAETIEAVSVAEVLRQYATLVRTLHD